MTLPSGAQRLDQPYIRENGRLRPASWSEAFATIAAKMKGVSPGRIGAIAGDLAAVEDMYAVKDLLTRLGSKNVDCRQEGSALDPSLGRASYIFNPTIAGIEHNNDFVVIDTPGTDAYLMRLAHAMADTLITPLNDSFVDFDVLGNIDPESFEVIGTSPPVYDTLRLSSEITPSIVLGVAATYFPSPHVGFHAELSYQGFPVDGGCVGPAVYRPDGENKNQQTCNDIQRSGSDGGAIAVFGGVTVRAAPRRFISPYARVNLGIVNQSRSTIEMSGAFVTANGVGVRQVISDPSPTRTAVMLGAAAGFTRSRRTMKRFATIRSSRRCAFAPSERSTSRARSSSPPPCSPAMRTISSTSFVARQTGHASTPPSSRTASTAWSPSGRAPRPPKGSRPFSTGASRRGRPRTAA